MLIYTRFLYTSNCPHVQTATSVRPGSAVPRPTLVLKRITKTSVRPGSGGATKSALPRFSATGPDGERCTVRNNIIPLRIRYVSGVLIYRRKRRFVARCYYHCYCDAETLSRSSRLTIMHVYAFVD
jgi:hypothetical protein